MKFENLLKDVKIMNYLLRAIYIDKVLKCINYTQISSINLNAFLDIKDFFYDINTSNNYELNKILKLEKRKQN